MVDYIRSDQPTLTITPDTATESLNIQVVNPTPTGGRPTVIFNQVYRRPTGSTGNWVLAGGGGPNFSFLDTFQRSGAQFDYFVRTDTFSESVTYTVTTPVVSGLWAYSAADPTTLAHYPYTDGGTESLDEQEAVLQFVGRTYPIVEAGIQETQTVGVNITIPFSDASWRAQVEWWRARKREKQTLLYRDGRGRVFAARIIGPVSFPPSRAGTGVTCTLQRIDYTASTTEIDPTYYNAGTFNAGGNGAYGNGAQGNGV
jgi:hypothetical protein